jgi:serine/threonine protein kinase
LITRRCPRCQSTYPPPARFCVRDGSPLVEVAGFKSGPLPSPTSLKRTAEQPALRADDEAATLSGALLDDRYQIMRKIGEGGMAYVYLAEDRGTGATLAIKVLSPRLATESGPTARLRREAQLAMRLNHPNVCRILRYAENAQGLRYLVMPYLDGETLSDLEVREGPLSVRDALPLLAQICAGLQHAHSIDIIHRDLKPENVMLVPDRRSPGGIRAVVMDFGLAKELRPGAEVQKLTSTGVVLGTPEFMSPEQIRGKGLDGRSDIFALGVLAFELLSGELPFSGGTAQELMIARLKGQARAMRTFRPDIPPRMEEVIAKALTRDREGRYPTMDAFSQALADMGSTASPTAQ